MMGSEWPAEDYAPADGAPVTQQTLKSSLALAWPARLSRGLQTIHGFARSPDAEITRVEWSANRGESWCNAKLVEPIQRYAWVRFELEWDAPRGKQTLMTRATDAAGRTQPKTVPFNTGGYLFNMITRTRCSSANLRRSRWSSERGRSPDRTPASVPCRHSL